MRLTGKLKKTIPLIPAEILIRNYKDVFSSDGLFILVILKLSLQISCTKLLRFQS